MRLSQFFEETDGQLSNTRLSAFIYSVGAIGISIYAVASGKLDGDTILLVATLGTIGQGSKVLQKKFENGNAASHETQPNKPKE